jgi:hypothetical protein
MALNLALSLNSRLGGIRRNRVSAVRVRCGRPHWTGDERPHRAPAGMAHSPNYRSRMRSRLRGTRRARSAGRVTQLATTRSRAAGDRDCLIELCARCTVGGALANSRKTPNPASAIPPPPGSELESPATVRPHRHRHTSDNTSRTAHCTTPGHAFAPSASTAAGTPTPAIGDTLAPNLQTFFDSTSISRARFAHYDRCAPTECVPRYVRPSHQAGDVSGSVP